MNSRASTKKSTVPAGGVARLQPMLSLYGTVAVTAARRATTAWPVAFSLIVYAVIIAAAGILAGGLGIVGGIVWMLVAIACASSYLHLLAQAVDGTRVQLADFKQGFGARFWDVMSVGFAFWILGFVLQIFGSGPKGPALQAIAGLAMAFFFNATPELLYQGRTRSFALLGESARFVLANPVAWFLPNLAFATGLLAATGALRVSHPGELLLAFAAIFTPAGLARAFAGLPPWAMLPGLLLVHYAMVFRGVLFQELSSGSARQRAYRARLRG